MSNNPDSQAIDENGNIQYFALDGRIPVRNSFENLKPFDTESYLTGISAFIRENLAIDPEKESEYERNINNFEFLTYLSQIAYKNDPRLINARYSDVIKYLYEKGCPDLYVFHKTGVITDTDYGMTVESSMFAVNEFWFAANIREAQVYKRDHEEMPFTIALPLLEMTLADEYLYEGHKAQYCSTLATKSFYSLNSAAVIDLRALPDEHKAAITSKIKIFTAREKG